MADDNEWTRADDERAASILANLIMGRWCARNPRAAAKLTNDELHELRAAIVVEALEASARVLRNVE